MSNLRFLPKLRTFCVVALLLPCLASTVWAQYTPAGCLNSAEELLGQLVNDYRQQNGLVAVPLSTTLTAVGQWHVEDARYATEVTGQWGSDPSCNLHTWYGIPGTTYTTCCYTSDHAQAACMWNKPSEISGGSYGAIGFELAAGGYEDVAAALNGWKNSPGHNDVILNLSNWASYNWLAMGVGVDESNGWYYLWFSTLADAQGPPAPCATATPPAISNVLREATVSPNPFNPRTTVSFELSRAARVQMMIHDQQGRRVREFAAEPREAGRHLIVWNGLDDGGGAAASGVYFVRLLVDDEDWTTKVALIR